MQAPISAAIPLAWNPIYARNPEIRTWLRTYDDSSVIEGLCVFSHGDDREALCARLVAIEFSEALRWARVLHDYCVADGLAEIEVPWEGRPSSELVRCLTNRLDLLWPQRD